VNLFKKVNINKRRRPKKKKEERAGLYRKRLKVLSHYSHSNDNHDLYFVSGLFVTVQWPCRYYQDSYQQGGTKLEV
jgi:hypothetical protein